MSGNRLRALLEPDASAATVFVDEFNAGRFQGGANRIDRGHSLVPLKTSVIEDELAKLGLSFQAKSGARRKQILVDAYEAGQGAAIDGNAGPFGIAANVASVSVGPLAAVKPSVRAESVTASGNCRLEEVSIRNTTDAVFFTIDPTGIGKPPPFITWNYDSLAPGPSAAAWRRTAAAKQHYAEERCLQ